MTHGIILGPCPCQGCGRLVSLWRGTGRVEWVERGLFGWLGHRCAAEKAA